MTNKQSQYLDYQMKLWLELVNIRKRNFNIPMTNSESKKLHRIIRRYNFAYDGGMSL